jgi:hypothetical protein
MGKRKSQVANHGMFHGQNPHHLSSFEWMWLEHLSCLAGWWFGTFFYFSIYIGIMFRCWLVVWNIFLFFHILGTIIPTDYFFRGIETTNQYVYLSCMLKKIMTPLADKNQCKLNAGRVPPVMVCWFLKPSNYR